MTKGEIAALRKLEEAAAPGPWRSSRDGNQYIAARYMPTAKCVGASILEGVVRPWNPHAYVAFGFKADEFEKARLLDPDADFIAAARNALPELLRIAEEHRRLVSALGFLNEYDPGSKGLIEAQFNLAGIPALAKSMGWEDDQ